MVNKRNVGGIIRNAPHGIGSTSSRIGVGRPHLIALLLVGCGTGEESTSAPAMTSSQTSEETQSMHSSTDGIDSHETSTGAIATTVQEASTNQVSGEESQSSSEEGDSSSVSPVPSAVPEGTSSTTTPTTSAPPMLNRDENIFPLNDAPIPRNALHSFIDILIYESGTLIDARAGFVAQENNGYLSDACSVARRDSCVVTACDTPDGPKVAPLYVDAGPIDIFVDRVGYSGGLVQTLEYSYTGVGQVTLDTGDTIRVVLGGGEYPAVEFEIVVPSFIEFTAPVLDVGHAEFPWPEQIDLAWDGGDADVYLDVRQGSDVQCTFASSLTTAALPQEVVSLMDQQESFTPYVTWRKIVETPGGPVVATVRRNVYHRYSPPLTAPVEFAFTASP